MQKLLMIIWTSLIVSSCVSPMPRFKQMTLCTPFIGEKIKCFCAKYDLNAVDRTEDFLEYPISYCHKMHGFILKDFNEEFEVVSREIQSWNKDEIEPISTAINSGNKSKIKKLAKKWQKK